MKSVLPILTRSKTLLTAGLVLLFLAVFAPFLAGNQPILVNLNGALHFPVLKGDTDYTMRVAALAQNKDLQWMVKPPVPFSPHDMDLQRVAVPPFSKAAIPGIENTRHWLGTDELGRDVLAQVIHGSRTSLMIALIAVALAVMIGILLGALGGYWHNRNLQLHFLTFFFWVVLVVLVAHVAWVAWQIQSWMTSALLLIPVLTFIYLLRRVNQWLLKSRVKNWSIMLTPDAWVLWVVHLITALPAYFILIALLAVWRDVSAVGLSVILGLLMWPDIARLMRASVISVRNEAYIDATSALGISPWRVVLRHIAPNAWRSALTTIGFAVGAAIVAESFLSFIGIASANTVSWGTLLASSRANPEWWWLSVFPGLALISAVLVFYRLSGLLISSPEKKA